MNGGCRTNLGIGGSVLPNTCLSGHAGAHSFAADRSAICVHWFWLVGVSGWLSPEL